MLSIASYTLTKTFILFSMCFLFSQHSAVDLHCFVIACLEGSLVLVEQIMKYFPSISIQSDLCEINFVQFGVRLQIILLDENN